MSSLPSYSGRTKQVLHRGLGWFAAWRVAAIKTIGRPTGYNGSSMALAFLFLALAHILSIVSTANLYSPVFVGTLAPMS